uniref:Uncharacterized protein n=1 Tax=Rhizochromulina marina TaxID=1034831 RepID=A0A7S2W184_9STRA
MSRSQIRVSPTRSAESSPRPQSTPPSLLDRLAATAAGSTEGGDPRPPWLAAAAEEALRDFSVDDAMEDPGTSPPATVSSRSPVSSMRSAKVLQGSDEPMVKQDPEGYDETSDAREDTLERGDSSERFSTEFPAIAPEDLPPSPHGKEHRRRRRIRSRSPSFQSKPRRSRVSPSPRRSSATRWATSSSDTSPLAGATMEEQNSSPNPSTGFLLGSAAPPPSGPAAPTSPDSAKRKKKPPPRPRGRRGVAGSSQERAQDPAGSRTKPANSSGRSGSVFPPSLLPISRHRRESAGDEREEEEEEEDDDNSSSKTDEEVIVIPTRLQNTGASTGAGASRVSFSETVVDMETG